MYAEMPDGTKLYSIFDGFDKAKRVLYEYKTSDRPEAWDQGIVDTHQQLSFYAYVYHLTHHRFFSTIKLVYINIRKGTVETFETVRSRTDCLMMEKTIENVIKVMKERGWWERRKSRKERHQLSLQFV